MWKTFGNLPNTVQLRKYSVFKKQTCLEACWTRSLGDVLLFLLHRPRSWAHKLPFPVALPSCVGHFFLKPRGALGRPWCNCSIIKRWWLFKGHSEQLHWLGRCGQELDRNLNLRLSVASPKGYKWNEVHSTQVLAWHGSGAPTFKRDMWTLRSPDHLSRIWRHSKARTIRAGCGDTPNLTFHYAQDAACGPPKSQECLLSY